MYFHFTSRETESERLRQLAKDTQVALQVLELKKNLITSLTITTQKVNVFAQHHTQGRELVDICISLNLALNAAIPLNRLSNYE